MHCDWNTIYSIKTILSKVRKQLGFTEPNIFPTAGARISPEIETFVHAIGIDMLAGYGLTESLATVSCNHRGKPFTVGSVGIPIEGLEIKIGENNEVLLKGPTITKGYYKRDEINKGCFRQAMGSSIQVILDTLRWRTLLN